MGSVFMTKFVMLLFVIIKTLIKNIRIEKGLKIRELAQIMGVTIHSFVDVNGRTSRLLMNLILLSHGLVIANIKGDYETRMRYFTTLEQAQTTDSKEAFHHFIADVEIECLEKYLKILGA